MTIAAVSFAAPADSAGELLGVFQFENALGDTQFTGFNQYLAGKLGQELMTGLSIKPWPLSFQDFFKNDSAKKENVRIALSGTFAKGKEGAPSLTFKILDLKAGTEQEKTIAVSTMEKEDIAQIILLKLKNFLEQGMLGRLNITSSPLGLSIDLDHRPSGITPKEFFLRSGRYQVELDGKYLVPYQEEIDVVPGKTINIRPEMEFKGYPTHYWFLGAAITTWELLVAYVLERSDYHTYQDAAAGRGITDKNSAYRSYRNARYVRIGVLGLAGAGWIGTGFCYFSNKSIKKHYFNKSR